uniref:(northern house mosquito) hypothetical protein n=1 Tax=Culex pipiens TaxID=7175 RepID=A0A8D8G2N2_CULPI
MLSRIHLFRAVSVLTERRALILVQPISETNGSLILYYSTTRLLRSKPMSLDLFEEPSTRKKREPKLGFCWVGSEAGRPTWYDGVRFLLHTTAAHNNNKLTTTTNTWEKEKKLGWRRRHLETSHNFHPKSGFATAKTQQSKTGRIWIPSWRIYRLTFHATTNSSAATVLISKTTVCGAPSENIYSVISDWSASGRPEVGSTDREDGPTCTVHGSVTPFSL